MMIIEAVKYNCISVIDPSPGAQYKYNQDNRYPTVYMCSIEYVHLPEVLSCVRIFP